jgi:thiosulfate/3-mercaptopyruvate sulfurtransferase
MSIDLVVSTEWLAEHLRDTDLRVVDMRGHVVTRALAPGVEEADYRGARGEYLAGHIPGAVYVDWTSDIIDPDDPVPVQIAPPERFAEAMAARGIGDRTHVVAVDHTGGQFATRLWWALRYYGHDSVSVLDRGWNAWLNEGRPVEAGDVSVPRAVFTPKTRPRERVTSEQLAELLKRGEPDWQLVDARDAGQYSGGRRRGPRGGHVPGAIHVPRELFFSPGGGFRPLDEIRAQVENCGLARGRATVAYCNGGVAATVVLFNLARLGYAEIANFDGSWNEWSRRTDLPAEGEGETA